ncbi:hypothetical protein Q7P37_011530 [Cladosporium fusiforme]
MASIVQTSIDGSFRLATLRWTNLMMSDAILSTASHENCRACCTLWFENRSLLESEYGARARLSILPEEDTRISPEPIADSVKCRVQHQNHTDATSLLQTDHPFKSGNGFILAPSLSSAFEGNFPGQPDNDADDLASKLRAIACNPTLTLYDLIRPTKSFREQLTFRRYHRWILTGK